MSLPAFGRECLPSVAEVLHQLDLRLATCGIPLPPASPIVQSHCRRQLFGLPASTLLWLPPAEDRSGGVLVPHSSASACPQLGTNTRQLPQRRSVDRHAIVHTATSAGSTPERYRAAPGTTSDPESWLKPGRSEEHTSELQSRPHLVCRLLLEQ